MRRRYRDKYFKLRVFLIVLLVLIILSGICFLKIQPVIIKYAESMAETIMLNSANESVIAILEKNDISYSDIVKLTSNADGYVTSLEIDVYKVNYLKSRISNQIAEIIGSKEYYNAAIPVGAFFGTYTSGMGPSIKSKMQLTTTAFVDFRHEFKSAGINQVLHIINIDIKINGSLVIAGYNKTISTSTSAIAAQTVIVGKSPDAFTNVIEGADDTIGGLINDYGAAVNN